MNSRLTPSPGWTSTSWSVAPAATVTRTMSVASTWVARTDDQLGPEPSLTVSSQVIVSGIRHPPANTGSTNRRNGAFGRAYW